MKGTIDSIITLAGIAAWLAGIVLAKGFWGTAAAVCLVIPAWYNVVERLMQAWGLT